MTTRFCRFPRGDVTLWHSISTVCGFRLCGVRDHMVFSNKLSVNSMLCVMDVTKIES